MATKKPKRRGRQPSKDPNKMDPMRPYQPIPEWVDKTPKKIKKKAKPVRGDQVASRKGKRKGKKSGKA